MNSSIPATAEPPTVLSVDCQFMRSLPRRVMMLVADTGCPSWPTPSTLTTHWLPVRREVAFAVAALGVEDPGLELSLEWVPADPLGAREDGPSLGLHGELAIEEVAAFGPRAGGRDDRGLAFVDPVAHEPLQLLEAVVGGEVLRELVAHGGLPPLSALFDVDGREAGDLGCTGTRGRRDRGAALLEGRLRAEETERVDLDGDRAPGIVGERCGVLVADGGPSLDSPASLVDDDRRLGVRGGGGLGVASVECLDELIEKRLDRLLVVAPTEPEMSQPPDRPALASSTPGRLGPGRSRRSRP